MGKKTLQQLLSNSSSKPNAPAAADPGFEARCPMLFSLLTDQTAVKGTPRRVATLSIFAADGVWKASLNERGTSMQLWASCDEMAGLVDALEILLGEDPIPWKVSNFGGRGGK